METPVVHPSLRHAQLAVMHEIAYIQRQHSADLGYSILTEQATIAAVRPAMLAHGIVMAPISVTLSKLGEYASKSGNRMGHVVAIRTFRFSHVESGEYQDVQVLGEGADTSDKAAAKACTYAKKLAIREFFCIETGQDETAVVEQRGAPNEAYFRRAIAAIKNTQSAPEAAEMTAKILSSQKAEWTAEQITAIHDIHQQHATWLDSPERTKVKAPTKQLM